MKPLAGVFLALACVLGIATTGCVFELAYGDPDLGVKTTSWILALAAPGTVGTLLFAIVLPFVLPPIASAGETRGYPGGSDEKWRTREDSNL